MRKTSEAAATSSVAVAATRGHIAGRDAAGIFKPDVTVALFVLDQLPTHHQQGIFMVFFGAPLIPVARSDNTEDAPVF